MGRVYISALRTEGPSVYQWSIPEKTSWVVEEMLFKYSTGVRLVKTPRLCGIFVDHPCRLHSLSNTKILSQKPPDIQIDVLIEEIFKTLY